MQLLLVSGVVFAQKTSSDSIKPPIKGEILFNVSDALGRATGNSNSGTFITDPILLGAKILRENSSNALRLGFNFRYVGGDEIGTNFQRVSKDEFYSFAAGIEKRKRISPKFQYYYGLDLRYFQLSTASTALFSRGGTEVFSSVKNGPGVAPVLGFRWDFAERFSLFTEASLSIELINNYRYVTVGGFKTVLEDKLETTLRPTAPGVIFITFDCKFYWKTPNLIKAVRHT